MPSLLHSLPSVDVTGGLLAGLTTRTPVGVFMSDASGACRYVNDRWCELTGLTFVRALGDGWAEAIHPDDRGRVAAEWNLAATEGRDSVIAHRFLRPDGTVARTLSGRLRDSDVLARLGGRDRVATAPAALTAAMPKGRETARPAGCRATSLGRGR